MSVEALLFAIAVAISFILGWVSRSFFMVRYEVGENQTYWRVQRTPDFTQPHFLSAHRTSIRGDENPRLAALLWNKAPGTEISPWRHPGLVWQLEKVKGYRRSHG